MERLAPWMRSTAWVYVALALVLAGLAWWTARPRGPVAVPSTAPAARVVRAAPPPVLVHVAGEVRRPGLYRLPTGGRIALAVRRAGGPTRRADLTGLNLAAPVQDGQQVLVPRRAPPGAPPVAAERRGPVSLSSATVEDLDALDGIGPTLAQRIVEWRTAHGGFARVDQLLDVPGFGEGRLEALRPHVVP